MFFVFANKHVHKYKKNISVSDRFCKSFRSICFSLTSALHNSYKHLHKQIDELVEMRLTTEFELCKWPRH